MELPTLLLLCAASLVVAALVVVSGFGLGTALTPLFLLVYDIKTAVFLTAIVHFANTFFRLALFRRHIDWGLLRRFGLLSVIGAVAGSLLQTRIGNPKLELFLGVLLVVLGGIELLPARTSGWKLPRWFDLAGGLASGLLGGLVGNQGALRSGYLLNYGLSKEAFIATGTAIAVLIDLSRLPVYGASYGGELAPLWPYLAALVAAALVGTLVGKRLVERLPQEKFRPVVAVVVALTGLVLIAANL
ncbi:MAG: sulfite exporter TauE/SafE family protein [Candidatus Acidiferrales bacterium]